MALLDQLLSLTVPSGLIPLSIVVGLGLLWYYRHAPARYPPGPPPKPLIGNILELPPLGAWHKLTKYKGIYGDLVFFRGLGAHVLVLNSMEHITKLLEKRATIYSDRPVFTVVNELMGLGQSMPMLPYNDEWRAQRRLTHIAMSPAAVRKYHRVQEDLAALLAERLLDAPDDFFSEVRLTASRIVLAVTYGISVEKADSEYITHAEETMEMISQVTVPGAFLCDFWPWMKHLPGWLPFQQKATRGREMIERLVSKPLEYVKGQMAAGAALPSLAQDLLLMQTENLAEHEKRVKWSTGALYGAGGETTYTTVLVFIATMAMHPDILKKAQAEVDTVLGADILPTIVDRSRLPYVNAIIKEVLRWHPALPLSIARQTAAEDVYEGYAVPEGTIVVPNVWAIAFEQHGKHNPHEFIPERFLDPDPEPDPAIWAFGFARRQCPGKHLAENSVFILIATIIAMFDISIEAGKALKLEYSLGLVSYPLPFECKITPRSEVAAKLVAMRASQCTDI